MRRAKGLANVDLACAPRDERHAGGFLADTDSDDADRQMTAPNRQPAIGMWRGTFRAWGRQVFTAVFMM